MKPYATVSTLVLTGILSLTAGLWGIEAARGEMAESPFSRILVAKGDRDFDDDDLPRSVQSAVVRDLSRRANISERQIRVVEASEETWPDSCLGLSRGGEFCSQVLTEGWRVVLSDGRDRWVYRTDETGAVVRLAAGSNVTGSVPQSVANSVLRDVSRRVGQPRESLQIAKAVQKTWPNGCLGVSRPGQVCTQALVEGWQVTVISDRNPGQRWIYHTDSSGDRIVLAESYDSQSTRGSGFESAEIAPLPIPHNELPQPLSRGMVFRAISSGGFAGRTYETVLMEDGTLIQVQRGWGNATDRDRRVTRIPRRDLRRFQRLLARAQFARYDGLSYPAPESAADYITVTLSSDSSTWRYADIVQENLPNHLQQAIASWNRIVTQLYR